SDGASSPDPSSRARAGIRAQRRSSSVSSLLGFQERAAAVMGGDALSSGLRYDVYDSVDSTSATRCSACALSVLATLMRSSPVASLTMALTRSRYFENARSSASPKFFPFFVAG